MAKATSKKGSLFIQPDGPNTEMFYLGCHTLGDLTDSKGGALTPFYCWKADGTGWDTVGETESPPDKVSFTIDTRVDADGALDWTEEVSCPFSVYALLRDCGRRDHFANNVRAWIIPDVQKLTTTYSGLVTMAEDVEQTMSTTFEASPNLIKVVEVALSQQLPNQPANYGIRAFNDVCFNNDDRCEADCGEAYDSCERGFAVGDGAGGFFAENQQTTTTGTTWTVAAGNPFLVNEGIMGVTRFYTGRTTLRVLVGKDAAAAAGAQGEMSYSDDNGATWTTANIGGAAAGDGCSSGGTLFSFDEHHIWVAGDNGYIWISTDAGLTYEATEEGIITANPYVDIDFVDELHGVAVAGTGNTLIATTDDGGLSWAAPTGTGLPAAILLCCERLDVNRIWIGSDAGNIYWSDDGGTTFTIRTGWVGVGVGDVEDLAFVNDHVGWMTRNDAAELATVYRTIDGGLTWDALTTPVNLGINQIWACDVNHAFCVGEPTASADSFIAYAQPA